MTEPASFPWEEAMALGLGVLRWTPDAFWRATPRELTRAAEGLSGGRTTPVRRGDLRRLMEAFPDEPRSGGGPHA